MELLLKICDEDMLEIKFAVACDSLEACCNENSTDSIYCKLCPRLGPFCSNEHLQRHKASLAHAAQLCQSGEAEIDAIDYVASVLGIQYRKMAYKRKLITQIKFEFFSVCDCKSSVCDCKSRDCDIIKLSIKNKDKNSIYTQVDLTISF